MILLKIFAADEWVVFSFEVLSFLSGMNSVSHGLRYVTVRKKFLVVTVVTVDLSSSSIVLLLQMFSDDCDGNVIFSPFCLAPLHLLSLQSHSSSMPGQNIASPRDEGVRLMQGTNQNTSEQTYHPGLSIKRRRWESAGSESPIESGKNRSHTTCGSSMTDFSKAYCRTNILIRSSKKAERPNNANFFWDFYAGYSIFQLCK